MSGIAVLNQKSRFRANISELSNTYDKLLPVAVFLAAFFICGAVIGNAAIQSVSESSISVQTASAANFWSVFLGVIKYPVIVWILGLSPLGAVLIPVICAVKGFCIAYSTASLFHALGTKGIWIAFTLSGAESIITLPFLLIIASQGFFASVSIIKQFFLSNRAGGSILPHRYHIINILSFAAITLVTVLQVLLSGRLLNFFA